MGLTVEAGAVPALPQLYKCRCFMDAALARDDLVYFNAGEHERLVAMTMHDYKSLVAPVVLSFAHEINSNIRRAGLQTLRAPAVNDNPLLWMSQAAAAPYLVMFAAGMCRSY